MLCHIREVHINQQPDKKISFGCITYLVVILEYCNVITNTNDLYCIT